MYLHQLVQSVEREVDRLLSKKIEQGWNDDFEANVNGECDSPTMQLKTQRIGPSLNAAFKFLSAGVSEVGCLRMMPCTRKEYSSSIQDTVGLFTRCPPTSVFGLLGKLIIDAFWEEPLAFPPMTFVTKEAQAVS
jgi:hypothetical protein